MGEVDFALHPAVEQATKKTDDAVCTFRNRSRELCSETGLPIRLSVSAWRGRLSFATLSTR